MITDLVFLDLETTGMDPQADRIIEIGALSYSREGRRQEFGQLINPGLPLPGQITRLTGIREEMLRDAPRIQEVKATLVSLLEGKTIVAHNAPFDLAFLREALGFPLENPVLDTLEFSKLVFPGLPSYSLSYLNKALLGGRKQEHRALADAQIVEKLFLFLLEKASRFSFSLLQGLLTILGGEAGDGLSLLLGRILQEKFSSLGRKACPCLWRT